MEELPPESLASPQMQHRIQGTLSRDNIMIRSDEGKGSGFTTDVCKFKLTYYVDGQPLDNSVTTLKDGSTTVANFITVPAI